MYGKLYESCFEGSMVGLGSDVFALWSYILAKAKFGMVDLNPRLVSAVIGMTEQQFHDALAILSAPDPKSRNPEEEGRRVVQRGPLQWEVVSWKIYEAFKSTEGHRAYMREARRASRERAAAGGDRRKSAKGEKRKKSQAPKVIGETKARPPAKWTRVPEDWEHNETHSVLAAQLNVDLLGEVAKFRDHEFKAPKTDADAAFRTWLRNAGQYSRGQQVPPRGREAPQDATQRQIERARRLREEEARQGATK